LWMLAAHLCAAVIAVSVLNVIGSCAARCGVRALASKRAVCLVFGFVLLSIALSNYAKASLAFYGWMLYAYAIPLALAISTATASVLWPLLDEHREQAAKHRWLVRSVVIAVFFLFGFAALRVPTLVGAADWNNIVQYSFDVVFWMVVAVAIYLLRPSTKRYTIYAITAATALAVSAYAGVEYSALYWASSLGETPAEIQSAVLNFSGINTSFGLVYSTLHPEPAVRCGEFCRILRQCTNMKDTIAKRDLDLVDDLKAANGPRPNIFLIVVDSMRPDYLGAYNPKVDFTPNLDAFARESVVRHHAFTSYAGTSLSEASIFAGALLLHSHYPKPFNRENNMRRLAQTDGYQLLVSDDPIVRQIMDPQDVKLDRGKAWNEVELGETYRQLTPYLDQQAVDKRPIFFYTQPQNVHQGTSNRQVEMTREDWQYRPGFDKVTTYRVHEVDNIFGKIVADLKARGIYDNSIIVLTADHGDGLPYSVCHGHNIEICPEVLRVPLIIHLPPSMRSQVVFDDSQVATPSDILPTLYYLLGHRPIEHELIFGRPLFVDTTQELESYRRKDLFFVSDARPAYGILLDDAHYMYLTYDSTAQSFFYDLTVDRDGRHDIVSTEITERSNRRLIEYLFAIGDYYGYRPTGGREGF
jgi:arylsulfatase A-like enzyme